jgi:hypothetical protein
LTIPAPLVWVAVLLSTWVLLSPASLPLAMPVRESGGDLRKLRQTHTAVDAIALRGIPAVGPGSAGGAIFGTRPEQVVCR